MENSRKGTNSNRPRSTRQVMAKLRFKTTPLDSWQNILPDTNYHAVSFCFSFLFSFSYHTISWNDFTQTKHKGSFRIEMDVKCFGSKATDEKSRPMKFLFKYKCQWNSPISISIITVHFFPTIPNFFFNIFFSILLCESL